MKNTRKKYKTMIFFILGCLIIGGIFELGLYSFVVHQGNSESPEKSDVLLVLGCRIHGDQPSLSLKYRLERTLELYKEGYGELVIVSGGQGSDEIISEAKLMKEYLVDRGIPSEIIFTEEQSTSTWENINYSKTIMDQLGLKSAVVVTNDFHIYRSISMAKDAGIKATGAPAPTVGWLKYSNRIRETLAVLQYWIFRK